MKKREKKDSKEIRDITNFIFEVGILSKTPRSGFHFLGSGEQSVSEHTNRVSYIGYALALMDGKVDMLKVLKMCLLHDISETRISDLNHIHQKYVERKEHNAIKDITDSVPFGKDMVLILDEYEKRASPEAILAKDADSLEWIISLKEEVDAGNTRAIKWMKAGIKRLKTPYAKKIASEILKTDSNAWWFGNKKVTI